MEIHLNPASLSKDQREAVAAFILTYPVDVSGTGAIFISPTSAQADALKTAPSMPLVSHASIGQDAPDVGRPEPTDAFRPDVPAPACDPAQAFGQVAPPLVPTPAPVVPAPSTAAVVQSPTALVVPPPPATVATTVVPSPPVPTPAPVAPAPSAPAAPTSPVGGVETDTDGLPWDARIHAGTKNKNADGRWKAKKGINDPALVERVKAELRQVMGTAPAPVAAPMPAPAVTVNAPAVPTPNIDTFVALVGRAAAAMNAGKITQDEVNAIAARWGVVSLPLAANRPDLVPSIAAEIDALIASR